MTTMRTRRDQVEPYRTKDGSTVRELMHPSVHAGVRNQSLAEAVVQPGAKTLVHRHAKSEELYHVLSGQGVMLLAGERFAVNPGDTVLIPPGTPHGLDNPGPDDLIILCCCAPAYSHEDTEPA
ncbi:mannose-6-phosphate isomerase [Desulfocurvibacter africanus PCS]|uniref:Mannose-6-phosphate isomerase n=1 Tax=Desulfocurvibacter africanus PCS TaxID=1262666 RepID=M5Q149_DESAF|nr:cupin domain-containing protein [Desulfocurvibacter africanus]EMG36243.1 mannose-6-phosphate isomerase [Desulfocurvibacter africanus PCS]